MDWTRVNASGARDAKGANVDYPLPEWEERGAALRVVFRPHPAVADEPARVPINVPTNVPINDRQRWFLDQLGSGRPVSAREIAAHFQVSEKTAKRDIADLQAKQLIEFVGARKTGVYRLREEQ